jgi:CHAT domain-containing protein
MWNWIKKAGQKAFEIGAGYLDNKVFINSLLNMSYEQVEEELQSKLQLMDSGAYSGFMLTLATMIQGAKQDIERLTKFQETDRSWGNSFEDEYAQFMAQASSGFRAPQSDALQQVELRLQMLTVISDRASEIYQFRRLEQAENVTEPTQQVLAERIKPAQQTVLEHTKLENTELKSTELRDARLPEQMISPSEFNQRIEQLKQEIQTITEQRKNGQISQEQFAKLLEKNIEEYNQLHQILERVQSDRTSTEKLGSVTANRQTEAAAVLSIPDSDDLIQAVRSQNVEEQKKVIEQVIQIFRSRNLTAQRQLIEQCPSFPHKEILLEVIDFNNQASHVNALGIIATGYSLVSPAELGVVFGKAGYFLAVEYSDYREPVLSDEILFTAVGQAVSGCFISLSKLGIYQEILDFGEEAFVWLEQETPEPVRDKVEYSLDTLRLRLIDANIQLKRYKQAQTLIKIQEASQQERSASMTLDNQFQLERLEALLDKLTAGPERLPSEQMRKTKSPEANFVAAKDQLNSIPEIFSDAMQRFPAAADFLSLFLNEIPEVNKLVDQQQSTTLAKSDLTPSERSGIASIEIGNRVSDFLASLGALSEVDQIRREINNASGIFLDPVKKYNPELVENSLAVLNRVKNWAEKNNRVEQECDALWGISHCYMSKARIAELEDTRKEHRAKSVEALQALRNKIEQIREQITDPFKRVYWLNQYEHLFPILCWQLYQLDRPLELLDAIESAKGRVLVDVLTRREHEPISDRRFSSSIQQLPSLMRELKAHYLTYLVDDDETYAVLVSKGGSLHTHSIPIGKTHLKKWIDRFDKEDDPINPKNWNKRKFLGSARLGSLPERLEPLISWLSPLAEAGILQKDDHLCYCPDEFLHLIPLQYIPFLGQPLVRFFSISRIQSAAALAAILNSENKKQTSDRPSQFTAVCVSSKADLSHPKEPEQKLFHLRWIEEWLAETQKMPGIVVANGKADLQAVTQLPFNQRLVHFAMHGIFPDKDIQGDEKNPYRSSGLLLAKDGQIPDDPSGQDGHSSIEQQSNLNRALFTPQAVIEYKLNFEGSHVTMEACVSGRAKEGIGGDAIGLEWALLLARASSVLSTHWNVNPTYTRLFSQKFYQKWLFEGDIKANAWRETILELMDNEASDPYYWAAFSLSGDWR